MEVYVYVVCVVLLIGGFCLLPIASLFNEENAQEIL
jgi:hypothetical protein